MAVGRKIALLPTRYSRPAIDRFIAEGKQKKIGLKKPVWVYFFYITAWATTDGKTHFRTDIYGSDKHSVLQLASIEALKQSSR